MTKPAIYQRTTVRTIFGKPLAYATAIIMAMTVVTSCGNGKKETAKTAEQAKTDSLAAANATLQSKYDAANAQIDAYATKASNLETLIAQKDAQIERLNKEKAELLRNNKKLVEELKANKKLISSLRDDLADTTRSYTARLGVLEHDKSDLMRQKDSLMAKYNQVVALASVLHASNTRITAIHEKRNGKEKNTKRARRADLLRIVFDIDENRIAENGTKKLYLVVRDPEGNLMSSTAAGSGTTTNSNGKPLNYSLMKEIALTTNEPVKDVTVDWNQEGEYSSGTYVIDIYNGGYRIGGGKAVLK